MASATANPMPKRTDISVKIDVGVYRKLRTVAAWKGLSVAEYLSHVVEPAMDKELARMAKEVSAEHQRPRPDAGGG